MAAAIYCGGLFNAGAFDSVQHLIVARAPEKTVAEGLIRSVDASERKLLISCGPISGALEMPAMVMSFRAACPEPRR
jgi:Cu/Ag efflux protein CusF